METLASNHDIYPTSFSDAESRRNIKNRIQSRTLSSLKDDLVAARVISENDVPRYLAKLVEGYIVFTASTAPSIISGVGGESRLGGAYKPSFDDTNFYPNNYYYSRSDTRELRDELTERLNLPDGYADRYGIIDLELRLNLNDYIMERPPIRDKPVNDIGLNDIDFDRLYNEDKKMSYNTLKYLLQAHGVIALYTTYTYPDMLKTYILMKYLNEDNNVNKLRNYALLNQRYAGDKRDMIRAALIDYLGYALRPAVDPDAPIQQPYVPPQWVSLPLGLPVEFPLPSGLSSPTSTVEQLKTTLQTCIQQLKQVTSLSQLQPDMLNNINTTMQQFRILQTLHQELSQEILNKVQK